MCLIRQKVDKRPENICKITTIFRHTLKHTLIYCNWLTFLRLDSSKEFCEENTILGKFCDCFIVCRLAYLSILLSFPYPPLLSSSFHFHSFLSFLTFPSLFPVFHPSIPPFPSFLSPSHPPSLLPPSHTVLFQTCSSQDSILGHRDCTKPWGTEQVSCGETKVNLSVTTLPFKTQEQQNTSAWKWTLCIDMLPQKCPMFCIDCNHINTFDTLIKYVYVK